ncbi:MAG: hypothetical protein FJX65_07830 [Alphaproteobacteria bacterium]|nr:hypothetical protein [Alphaproteobacteria bacterium]
MPSIYVAKSRTLTEWGHSVGLTKHLYLVAFTAEKPDAAVAAMNAAGFAGQSDWVILKKEKVEGVDPAAALAKLSAREKMVDPDMYPKIKGVRGIFKVKFENVENHFMVKRALAGTAEIDRKTKPADIGTYLIRSALD